MFFSVSFPVALYWFNNEDEGNWYPQVNLIYLWLCEGSIYLGERIMYLSFTRLNVVKLSIPLQIVIYL